jgi:hypothetical protein
MLITSPRGNIPGLRGGTSASQPRTHFRPDMLLFVLSLVVGIRTKPIFEESEEQIDDEDEKERGRACLAR